MGSGGFVLKSIFVTIALVVSSVVLTQLLFPVSEKPEDLKAFLQQTLRGYPHKILFKDWQNSTYSLGTGEKEHWYGKPLEIHVKTVNAGQTIMKLDSLGFLEHFVKGEIDITGNQFMLSDIGNVDLQLTVPTWRVMMQVVSNLAFQSVSQARESVKSHYDLPQEVFDEYLDKVYMSYSSAIFEEPDRLDLKEALTPGKGQSDTFDSLEKAQWRKFRDAISFIDPKEGEEVFDIGCGYAGQLAVDLEEYQNVKVVGWTHSANQVRDGKMLLSKFPKDLWELHEGDYRKENRTFDHLTSTGMISHVGPRGLEPYVQHIRSKIKTGGRYIHHSLMTPDHFLPFDFYPGPAFNKKYVWPGFHWFTLSTHVKVLEQNGFEVVKIRNLSPHYGKTTFAWYHRMMEKSDVMRAHMGEETFRAWQIYLSGACAGFLNHQIHIYRIYAQAV